MPQGLAMRVTFVAFKKKRKKERNISPCYCQSQIFQGHVYSIIILEHSTEFMGLKSGFIFTPTSRPLQLSRPCRFCLLIFLSFVCFLSFCGVSSSFPDSLWCSSPVYPFLHTCLIIPPLFLVFFQAISSVPVPGGGFILSLPSPVFLCLAPPAPCPLVSLVNIQVQFLVSSLSSHRLSDPDPAVVFSLFLLLFSPDVPLCWPVPYDPY